MRALNPNAFIMGIRSMLLRRTSQKHLEGACLPLLPASHLVQALKATLACHLLFTESSSIYSNLHHLVRLITAFFSPPRWVDFTPELNRDIILSFQICILYIVIASVVFTATISSQFVELFQWVDWWVLYEQCFYPANKDYSYKEMREMKGTSEFLFILSIYPRNIHIRPIASL